MVPAELAAPPPLPTAVVTKISSYLSDADRRALGRVNKSFWAALPPMPRGGATPLSGAGDSVRPPRRLRAISAAEESVALVVVSALALLVVHCLTAN
jgi:hypothetical protein